ncbi:MAG: PrsW family intramembrane metalloprotease, partial [Lachnospiraceae bacterium]|nr:PrsW family intramembrane metalloprotease [Lachnospiraceae bacterium]
MRTLLVALAALPALVLIFFVYKQDKKEKEPKGLLFKLVMFGFISIIPAVIIELIFSAILYFIVPPGSIAFAFIECFVIVAGAEEGSKFLMLKLGSWKNKEFNYTFDGIVYAVCTGLGFAILENILYVLQSGVGLAITRAFTAIMAHAVFGVVMGVFYGRARQFESLGNKKMKNKNLARGLIYSMLLHGLYDFLLSIESVIALIVFVVLLIGIYVLMFVVVIRASKSDVPAVPMYYAAPGPIMPPQGSQFNYPPQYGQPMPPQNQAPQYNQPVQPQYQAPQYSQPAQPQYQAPQYSQPAQPQYRAPQYSQPAQPQYQAPQYSQPAQPQYQAPQYNQPVQPQYQTPQYNQAPQQQFPPRQNVNPYSNSTANVINNTQSQSYGSDR